MIEFPPLLNSFITQGSYRAPANLAAPLFIVFRNRRDFTRAVNPGHFGGFMESHITGNRILLHAKGTPRAITEAAFHEYAHHLIRASGMQGHALWYEEGLVSLAAAARRVDGELAIREIPSARSRTATTGQLGEFAEVLGARRIDDWSSRKIDYFYSTAWLLARYLHLRNEPNLIAKYQLEPDLGLLQTLGISQQRLLNNLVRYEERGSPGRWSVPLANTSAERAIDKVCAPQADTDYQIARAATVHNPKWARTQLERLLKNQPEHSPFVLQHAQSVLYSGDPDHAEKILRDWKVKHPDDPDTMIELANLLTARCSFRPREECADTWNEASSLFRSALEQTPDRIDAVYGLGVTSLHTGRAGNALNYLRAAYRRAPWDVPLNFYLGEGYRILGDRRARNHLSNAFQWSRSDLWQERAKRALSLLDEH